MGQPSHFIGVLLLEGVEMKQRELFSSAVVTDRERIQFYLARLMRILKGEVK